MRRISEQDLNGDGYLDLIIANAENGVTSDLDSYVYKDYLNVSNINPDGNLTLLDDVGSATGAGKQFITLVTKTGNTFYLIIDTVELNESIHALLPIFEDQKSIYSVLKCMDEIGMGYVSLGQMSMNLSGGEAKRIKLAKYLGLSSKGSSLYILDEPTSGLSTSDIDRLVGVINRLVENGETIVIIEHNVEFIARIADHLK